jgi:hypothetical protein
MDKIEMPYSEVKQKIKLLRSAGYERYKFAPCGFRKVWEYRNFRYYHELTKYEFETPPEIFIDMLTHYHNKALHYLSVMVVTGGHGI